MANNLQVNNLIDYDKLKDLPEDERKYIEDILKEYSNTGASKKFEELTYYDYKEIPVDIITFIKDKKYLGDAWHSPDGKCKLYPYWEDKLKELFPDNLTTAYNDAIFSGARGLGKSEIAITCILYIMYRVMCLKNPHEFFELKPTEKISFALMNITKDLSKDIAVSKFQKTVQMSPWFLARGTMTQFENQPYWNPPDYIDIIVGSQPSHVIGKPILAAFFDEISFIRNKDVEIQKQVAIDMIDTAIGGMKTRFIIHGKNPSLLILASSKRSEKSFLEEHMKKKLQEEGESDALIVDEAVWDIKPADTYSGLRFPVAVGNRFLSSEIIKDESLVDAYRNRGYRILSVPIEFKSDFRDNIDRALCDFAGISSSNLSKYISGVRWSEIVSNEIHNPFNKEVLEVGNAKDDKAQYSDFFDLEKVDPKLRSMPLFIHLDMSKSGDNTGIAGVWIKGKKIGKESNSKELYYQVAFAVAIKAPKGYQVSFAKNREFIYWLKSQGFNIKGISSDTYQNAAIEQDLLASGYNYEVISVDRTNKDNVCEPYAYFKNCIYEKRLEVFNHNLLTEEIIGLERNGNNGKIDHEDGGRFGSKDVADAVCGSLWNASQHADEFAFDYGEDLNTTVDVSSYSENEQRRQITLDFEEELKKAFGPDNAVDKSKDGFQDFGMGKAKPLVGDSYYYWSQGIII